MTYISFSDAEFIGKVYINGDSLTLTIPKIWANTLDLHKGDLVRVNLKRVDKNEHSYST